MIAGERPQNDEGRRVSTPIEWWLRKTKFERTAYAVLAIVSYLLLVFVLLRLL